MQMRPTNIEGSQENRPVFIGNIDLLYKNRHCFNSYLWSFVPATKALYKIRHF